MKFKMNSGTRAIAGRIMGFGNRGGTQISGVTFMVAVGFVFTVLVYMIAVMLSFRGFNDWTHGSNNVLIVNAPDSLIEYAQVHEPDRRLILDEWDAIYDYNHMLEVMEQNDVGVTIVFDNDAREILTYYRAASPDYSDIRTTFVDGWLESYFMHTIPDYNVSDKWDINESPIQTQEEISYNKLVQRSLAQTFIPLIIFIAILYAAMSSGTEAVAGQKERGTFAGLILSPMKRSDIVLGFTYGVLVKTLIPAIILEAVCWYPGYLSFGGLCGVFLLTVSLAFMVAALTIMISIMNDTVTSAQTAFLPVFFVLVIVAVTCINESSDVASFYYFLPVYGQFFGIGACLNREANFPGVITCSLLTVGMGVLMTWVSTKLISREGFIVSYAAADDSVQKDKILPRIFDKIAGLVDTVVYPLAVLSIYQLLAMIPVVIAYMKDPVYSDFIADLRGISTVSEVIVKTTQILAIFMNDSRFLALMTVGYFLIIFTYAIRARGFKGLGLVRSGFGRHYALGILGGIGMMSLVFVIMCITGICKPTSFGLPSGSLMTFIFTFLMWFPQGASEEVMFRGYMIPKLSKLFGKPFAIICSSLLFSVFHTMNAGFTFLAFLNIFLFAILFALIYEMTGSIAFTCAAHTMWNLCQGSIYGLSVSGNATVSLITSNYTGAEFGPEGTIEATIVIVIALGIALILRRKSASRPST